jgi:hypothetical protein
MIKISISKTQEKKEEAMGNLSKTIRWTVVALGVVLVAFVAGRGRAAEQTAASVVVNPYADVNWEEFQHHRAALHTHTLQSDGRHPVEEVIAAYREAGFTILAITDHDTAEPNVHVKRGSIPEERATPYPRDPKPENYPANTTWPWTEFGGPAPEAVGMVGIEGNELSYRHHINSLFNGFGDVDGKRNEDELLLEVKRHRGLAFLCHPGIDAKWWTRQPVEWYADRFEKHDPAYLVGIEVTNGSVPTEKYDEGLWDQLLARFMPERPIWGIGTDDMHALDSVRESDSVFLLAEACPKAVRSALEKGQFYLRKSTRRDDFRKRRPADELFPRIKAIHVDDQAGTITVQASNYDAIHWISAPESLEPVADYKTSNEPWPLGCVVHKGETINYRNTPLVKNYLRVELLRQDGEDLFRTFTNPFGLARTVLRADAEEDR